MAAILFWTNFDTPCVSSAHDNAVDEWALLYTSNHNTVFALIAACRIDIFRLRQMIHGISR